MLHSDPLLKHWVDAQTDPLECADCTRPLGNDQAHPWPENFYDLDTGRITRVEILILCAPHALARGEGV